MTEHEEWRDAVDAMTEMERAPYDEPQVYADTMAPDGTRL
jgi:hypothetical protein